MLVLSTTSAHTFFFSYIYAICNSNLSQNISFHFIESRRKKSFLFYQRHKLVSVKYYIEVQVLKMEQKMNNFIIEEQKKRPFHHDEYDDVVCSFFTTSSSSDCELSNGSSLELGSDSDSFEEVTSQTSSSSSSSSSSTDQLAAEGEVDPLSDMSSLFQQLPMKRGLSKFYQGRSQSFTSLTKVKSLEDLVKPESPYNKKLKSCKSYGGFNENQDSKFSFKSTSAISKLVSKRGVSSASSRGSCSSLNARRGSSSNFMGSRPPIHPHRSSTSTNNISNQTALFA